MVLWGGRVALKSCGNFEHAAAMFLHVMGLWWGRRGRVWWCRGVVYGNRKTFARDVGIKMFGESRAWLRMFWGSRGHVWWCRGDI